MSVYSICAKQAKENIVYIAYCIKIMNKNNILQNNNDSISCKHEGFHIHKNVIVPVALSKTKTNKF